MAGMKLWRFQTQDINHTNNLSIWHCLIPVSAVAEGLFSFQVLDNLIPALPQREREEGGGRLEWGAEGVQEDVTPTMTVCHNLF